MRGLRSVAPSPFSEFVVSSHQVCRSKAKSVREHSLNLETNT